MGKSRHKNLRSLQRYEGPQTPGAEPPHARPPPTATRSDSSSDFADAKERVHPMTDPTPAARSILDLAGRT